MVSVRLALFAEMVKGKPWIPSTLEEVGGTEGIGVNFLEETFSSRKANPEHRLHQQAAREVLRALLPEVGTDIKGHMRSHAELLAASGYQDCRGRVQGPAAYSGWRIAADHAHRSRRLSERLRERSRLEVLPAHPRLPRAVATGVADPQTERNAPRQGGTATGRAGGVVERQAGEPPPARLE